MHDSMTRISRGSIWTVIATAIEDGKLDSGRDEPTAAAYTLGPILYRCLSLWLAGGEQCRSDSDRRPVDSVV